MSKINNNGPYYTPAVQAGNASVPGNYVNDSPNNKEDVEVINKNLNTVHGTSTSVTGANQWGPYYSIV